MNNAKKKRKRARSVQTSPNATFWSLFSLVVLLVLSGLVCWLAARHISFGFNSTSWPTVQGRIVQSIDGGASLGSGSDGPNPGKVTYEYEADGRVLTGRRVSFAYDWRPIYVERIYPAGASVTIYYDPNKPERSVLIPGNHTSSAGWSILAFALPIALMALDFSLGVAGILLLEKSGPSRRALPIRQPDRLVMSIDDADPDNITLDLAIPKTRIAYGLYLRVLVYTASAMFFVWLMFEGKYSIVTLRSALLIILVLFVLIHRSMRPRLSVWIGRREVGLCDTGRQNMLLTPLRGIKKILANERYMSIEYLDRKERSMAKHTRSCAGLPAGTLPWLAALLVFLKSHPRQTTRKTDIPVWRLYGFATPKDFLAAVTKGKR